MFILDTLAVARLTKLVVEDEITQPMRDYVTGHYPNSKVGYLVSCPACVSVWAAGAVGLMGHTALGRTVRRTLALSEAVLALRRFTDDG